MRVDIPTLNRCFANGEAAVNAFIGCPTSFYAINDHRRHRPADGQRKSWSLYTGDYGCSCHINPPCSHCTSSFECTNCQTIEHEDDGEIINGKFVCQVCIDGWEREYNDHRSPR